MTVVRLHKLELCLYVQGRFRPQRLFAEMNGGGNKVQLGGCYFAPHSSDEEPNGRALCS